MEVLDNDEFQDLDIIEDDSVTFDYDKTYYLAGPMSGYPEYNFGEFAHAARHLRRHNIKVNSPHEIDHGETEETRGSLPYEVYMKAGLDLLAKSDGIILLRGWPTSTGAMRELADAIDRSIPVYFFHDPWDYRNNVELVSMNRRPKP